MSEKRIYFTDDSAESGSSIPAGNGEWWETAFVEGQNGLYKLNYSKVDSESKAPVFLRYKIAGDTDS